MAKAGFLYSGFPESRATYFVPHYTYSFTIAVIPFPVSIYSLGAKPKEHLLGVFSGTRPQVTYASVRETGTAVWRKALWNGEAVWKKHERGKMKIFHLNCFYFSTTKVSKYAHGKLVKVINPDLHVHRVYTDV